MDDEFKAICGISKNELTANFREDIQLIADKYQCSYDETLEKLKFHYDGYHFSSALEDIFNPLSVLQCLKNKEFRNFWFETATSSYVINHLKHFEANILEFEGKELFESGFYTSHEDFNSIYPLLYQAGYLTIKGYNDITKRYLIGYPNQEVRISMIDILMPSYVGCSSEVSKGTMCNFYFSIKKGEYEKGFDYLKTFLA